MLEQIIVQGNRKGVLKKKKVNEYLTLFFLLFVFAGRVYLDAHTNYGHCVKCKKCSENIESHNEVIFLFLFFIKSLNFSFGFSSGSPRLPLKQCHCCLC